MTRENQIVLHTNTLHIYYDADIEYTIKLWTNSVLSLLPAAHSDSSYPLATYWDSAITRDKWFLVDNASFDANLVLYPRGYFPSTYDDS